MNALTQRESAALPSLQVDEKELIDVLRNSLYPGATDGSIKMVIGYCKASNLDPMQKPVHIVPMNVKKVGTRDQYEWRDIVMPGIGLYRIQAARTGEHVGTSEPEYGPMIELTLGDKKFTVPEWCKVIVFRWKHGQACAYEAKEYWIENYATAGRDNEMPNAMWKKRPRGQLAKCAEAQALRRAFPEVGEQPTAEEMEGKFTYDQDVMPETPPTKPTVEQPRSKSAKDANVTDVTPTGGDQAAQTTGNPVSTPQASQQAQAPVAKPISDSALRVLKVKMENASVTESDLKKKFGFDLDAVTTANYNEIVDWLKDPTQ